MKKWICQVCGYVYEGENPPEKCPQCGVPASKFSEQKSTELTWAAEHVVGVAKGVDEEIVQGRGVLLPPCGLPHFMFPFPILPDTSRKCKRFSESLNKR